MRFKVALGSRDALQTCRALTWDTREELAEGAKDSAEMDGEDGHAVLDQLVFHFGMPMKC